MGCPPLDLPGLLRRCRLRDEAAWEEFYACLRRVTAGVLSRFQNLSPVERELAGDNARAKVIGAALENRIGGTTNAEILRFFQMTVTNAARDVWRGRHPTEALPPLLRDGGPSPLDATKARTQLDCVLRAMQSWPEDSRFVFVMKLNGTTTSAIKADLERLFDVFISTEAVDTRFHRLRAEIRQRCEGSA